MQGPRKDGCKEPVDFCLRDVTKRLPKRRTRTALENHPLKFYKIKFFYLFLTQIWLNIIQFHNFYGNLPSSILNPYSSTVTDARFMESFVNVVMTTSVEMK